MAGGAGESLRVRASRLAGRGGATALLLAVVAAHLLGLLPFQDTLRTLSFDLYQTSAPRERASAPAVIVDIDEASLARHGQWPWPRSLTARLLERVWAAGPAAVGVDILMPERDRFSACDVVQHVPALEPALAERLCSLPDGDALLARAIGLGPTVLGVAGVDVPSRVAPRAAPMRTVGEDPHALVRRYPGALANVPVLEAAAAGHAVLSADLQRGVVRRVPMLASVAGTVMPSLSLETLRAATGSPTWTVRASNGRIEGVGVGDVFVPTQADGSIWVRYGPHDEARFVSAAQVLDGTADPELLRGRLVLLGVSGLGLVDLQTTALGERVPGVEVHAQVLETVFEGRTLLRPHHAPWLEAVLMLAAGLAIAWGFPRIRPALLLPIMLAGMASLWLAGLAAFTGPGLLIDVASPMSILGVMFGFMTVDSLVREELRRRTAEDDLRTQREREARMLGEMEAARRIQMGLLPDVAAGFADEPRLDIAASMEPATQVGGDLYDVFRLDADRVFFSIGDVCGKGVASSLFMVVGKTLCKSVALREPGERVDPGEVMTRLNLELSRDNPEMLFVTAFCGVLDLRTGELAWCNAGHDAPLRFVPGAPPAPLEGRRAPALCIVDAHVYRSERCTLAPGEFLCLYTDGVTEAFDAGRQAYGAPRLLATLEAVAPGAGAADVLDALRADVRRFEAGAAPSDDLTAIVLRRAA